MEENLGSGVVSLSVGSAYLQCSLSLCLLRKQEGASNLLNLCIDNLSCSAGGRLPELICLFKLLVVIVTSPMHIRLAPVPSPSVPWAQVLFFWVLEGLTHLWGRPGGGGNPSLRP